MALASVAEMSFGSDQFPLSVSGEAYSLDAHPAAVAQTTAVVNLGSRPALIDGGAGGLIAARSSTILKDASVTGDLLACIGLPSAFDPAELSSLWTSFYEDDGPVLLRSCQVRVADIEVDIRDLLHRPSLPPGARRFSVHINLWFSPAGTNCGIHRAHDFAELHTQIVGLGQMQKFRSEDPLTIYEMQPMAPGTTSPLPFCTTSDGRSFIYPWHQYRADTDAVWLAVEYHATE